MGYSPYTGYEPNAKETSFGIGLQGIHQKDVPRVQDIIHQTLSQAAEQGFEAERVEALLHQLELAAKNVTAHFGLTVVGGITPAWIHGADPVEQLKINQHIERLREEVKKGGFFEQKIKKYLLNNNHKVVMEMNPGNELE